MTTSLDPRAIHIQADGSCYRNPGGEAGCAAIVHYPDHLNRADEQIVDFGCIRSTNQRMELMACIKALKWVCNNAPWSDVTRVLILTDSQYITQNLIRAPSWKKAGWRNSAGEHKFNHDLWRSLLKLRAKASNVGVRVDFVWQKGKKTNLAKWADHAAKAAATRRGIDVDSGYRPGAVSRSMVKGGVAVRFPASGQILVVRPYAKKIMRGGENRISFNVFDEASQAYAGKLYAFADPLHAAELHRGNGHRVRFNSEPDYPKLLERIEGVQLPRPSSTKGRTAES